MPHSIAPASSLRLLALNCTLKSKRANEKSSTDILLEQLLEGFAELAVKGEIVRVVDLNIKPGVSSDEGRGDAWPKLRTRILASDILLIGTPIWLGQPSSVAKRVLERMDAFIYETDDKERMPSYGKVAVAAVVGNEDGAHHVSAELYQALSDVGFTVPPDGVAYWVGEALGKKDYKDLLRTPKPVRQMIDKLTSNAAHLARILRQSPYPGVE